MSHFIIEFCFNERHNYNIDCIYVCVFFKQAALKNMAVDSKAILDQTKKLENVGGFLKGTFSGGKPDVKNVLSKVSVSFFTNIINTRILNILKKILFRKMSLRVDKEVLLQNNVLLWNRPWKLLRPISMLEALD